MFRSRINRLHAVRPARGVELVGSTFALLLPTISAAAGSPTMPGLRGIDDIGLQDRAALSYSYVEPITAPTMSIISAVSRGDPQPRNISSLSITPSADAPADAAEIAENEASRTNYLGHTIDAAATRFWEDFEDGQLGPEWADRAPIVESQTEGKFSYIPTDAGMTLNLKTKKGEVYEAQIDLLLFPPASPRDRDAGSEDNNLLAIKVDGQVVVQFAPEDIAKLRGEAVVPGQPVRRKIRVPFNAGFGIAEIRFEATDPKGAADWSRWAIDNILVDLGLQDPVFGFSGKMTPFDPGLLGMVGLSDGLTGELPPGKRFGDNSKDFSGGGGGGGGGTNPPPDRSIPSPGGVAVGALALAATFTRRRRAA